MPDPFPIVLDYNAIQYDGTNSAQIDSLVTNLAIVSEVGGVLTIESPVGSSTYVINTDDFVVWTQGSVQSTYTPSAFDFFYSCNVTCDLDPDVAPAVRAIGVGRVPTLLIGGTATIAVQLQPAMPDTNFDAYASKFAAVSLNDLTITGVSIVDTDTVNVSVENDGLVTLAGASVMVHAVS